VARHFNIGQAESLLVELSPELRRALTIKAELDKIASGLEAVSRRVSMSGGALVNRDELVQAKAKGEALAARLKEIIESVHGSGCLIKDLDSGLVDFPTLFQGREVYLCWKLGEEGIHFWHEVADGFRGRKPIDQELLDNHRGDPPS
jgi:hypothetical protein